MLSLKEIRKVYEVGDSSVEALRGVSIDFRKNEFVSILGPSGCGKTTLLNIIGGLDSYTDGDLAIAGISTKLFNASDWDSYRNHSIGFVFQSYNLIPHQTILSNVELALTLSGVSKSERRKRATEALEKVGLGNQLKKKPNQLSGGQMQRVAIARALVNDPEILLADEPTGALDSETSVQIMEILKEIASDRLVIMVTHNPDLANEYSTRIVRLLDGKIVDDSDPYTEEMVAEPIKDKKKKKNDTKYKKTSMSLFTALSLSKNNLLTKKGRTVMISFAGSIGIIGIALILSLSTGINNFINDVQRDTLSSYPIQITAESVDMNSLVESLSGKRAERQEEEGKREENRVYQNTIMYDMMNTMISTSSTKNNLSPFKDYLEDPATGLSEYISGISFGYSVTPNIYSLRDDGRVMQVNPSTVLEAISGENSMTSSYQNLMTSSNNYQIWSEILPNEAGDGINELIKDQYDVVYGEWPDSYDEAMLFITERNEINDMVLYSLGLKDPDEIQDIMKAVMSGEEIPVDDASWSYDELCGLEFRLMLPTDKYQQTPDGTWEDMSENDTYMSYKYKSAVPVKIVGIARPNDSALATAMNGSVGYTKMLTDYLIDKIGEAEIIKNQTSDEIITAENNPYKSESLIGWKFTDVDVFTGLVFEDSVEGLEEPSVSEKAEKFMTYVNGLTSAEKAELYKTIASIPTDEQLQGMLSQYMSSFTDRAGMEAQIIEYYGKEAGVSEDEIRGYLATLSDDELNKMVTESLTEMIKQSYAAQVLESLASMSEEQLAGMLAKTVGMMDEAKLAESHDSFMPSEYSESSYEENITTLNLVKKGTPTSINIYATSFDAKEEISRIISEYNDSRENEADKITYTDYVALMMSSVSTIINAISYVLIAFVAISLVVSSIMIGIITYISVLERTKEIGILRAIGASKRDISRVFNAEALILGFCAGVFGVVVTVILNIPISIIIQNASGISGIASKLPPIAAVILLAISMFLTFIAGLIPSRVAANKDPVVALRTE